MLVTSAPVLLQRYRHPVQHGEPVPTEIPRSDTVVIHRYAHFALALFSERLGVRHLYANHSCAPELDREWQAPLEDAADHQFGALGALLLPDLPLPTADDALHIYSIHLSATHAQAKHCLLYTSPSPRDS